jgi:magnesium-transporting ATPase (P-type)
MALSHQPIWVLSVEQVYESLGSNPVGLTANEAFQRFQQLGANELPEPPHRPLWLKFVDQLTHLMALLLWVAGILAFVSNSPQLGWAIWAVVLINAIFSFWQEFQAEQALTALKKVLPMQVKVQRDSQLLQIPVRELVPGDVMQLEEGDRVPADARLVSAESLTVDVSVMTGESLPVARNAMPVKQPKHLRDQSIQHPLQQPLPEKVNPSEIANLVLAGSTIAAGRAVAVVYATGAQTEFGQVAHLTTVVNRETSSLEVQVAQIVRVITAIALSMGVIIFGLAYFLVGIEIKESFLFAIGIIVALVPEGLLPTVTLSLAIGVRRMAKQNALVRRLSAVESLSATTVICTDKTGTLTKNEMTVRYLWLPQNAEVTNSEPIEVTGAGYDPTSGQVQMPNQTAISSQAQLLLIGLALCSNARLVHLTTPTRWQEIGDPTEAALLVVAAKARLNVAELQQQLPRIREIPFDSRRLMMTVGLNWHFSTIWADGSPYMAFTKGAPLEVLKHCQKILRSGVVQKMTTADYDEITAQNDRLAQQGFRVLGLAARRGGGEILDLSAAELEQNLVFVGLVAMFDPPRPEVPGAIAHCHQAGIKVTMVTGDYGLTAEAIAHQIGLVPDQVRVITGSGMSHLSDAQLRQVLKYRTGLVFARMSPEHKLRLVQAYKDIGEVVAVTGDGVNDAPALRAAHIGIAMGRNGTDVAREAADIVLTDDNFATIVTAIEQGRSVYQNIRKFMTYILASNVAELVPFLAMVALKIPPALIVMQILIVDLGTDILPALALGKEKAETGMMQLSPRPKNKPLLDRSLLLRAYCFLGTIKATLAMLGFFLVWNSYGYDLAGLQAVAPTILAHTANPTLMLIYAQSTTMTLATIVACQDGNVFACRSERSSIFRLGFLSNPWIWLGIATEWILIITIIQLPWMRQVFSTTPLTLWQCLFLFFCPTIVLGAEEIRKVISKRARRQSQPPDSEVIKKLH